MPVVKSVRSAQTIVRSAISAKKPCTVSRNTQPMASKPAGTQVATAITPSRDSHDVRHCEKARHARSGRPRCAVEASSPPAMRTNARAKPTKPSQRPVGTSPSKPNTASHTSNPNPAPEAVVNTMTE